MFSSVFTIQATTLKPRKWKVEITLALLFATVLLTGLFAAMDTVIPGMEKASEAQKKAVRDQRARDSVRQQEEMGRQRFETRMRYKSRLVEGMRIEAVARKAMIAREIELNKLAVQESHNNASKALRFIACMGMLSSGAFLFRRQISSLDWLIALEEWFSSTHSEQENPAKRFAWLERKAEVQMPSSSSVQRDPSASQASDSNTLGFPAQTHHPELEEFLNPLLPSTHGKAGESSILISIQTGPVDMEALLACANGDVQKMSGMAMIYLEQTRTRIDKIIAALTKGSRSEAIRWVKLSASASEFCGMKSMRMAFEKLLVSIQTEAIPDALGKVDSVNTECDQVRGYLLEHLSTKEKV